MIPAHTVMFACFSLGAYIQSAAHIMAKTPQAWIAFGWLLIALLMAMVAGTLP